jgi:predicted transcriptional regulator
MATHKAMTIRLSPEQAEELELVAAVAHLPVSEIVRSAIAEYVENRKQDKAFRKGLRARIERAQRMIGS